MELTKCTGGASDATAYSWTGDERRLGRHTEGSKQDDDKRGRMRHVMNDRFSHWLRRAGGVDLLVPARMTSAQLKGLLFFPPWNLWTCRTGITKSFRTTAQPPLFLVAVRRPRSVSMGATKPIGLIGQRNRRLPVPVGAGWIVLSSIWKLSNC
jgi:hypothetical protein